MRKTLLSLFILLFLNCYDFKETKFIGTQRFEKQMYEFMQESYEIGFIEGALMIKYSQTKLEYKDIEILGKFNAKKFVNRMKGKND